FASVRAFANALEQASQSDLPTERARSAPFSSELPPADTLVPPPATATPLAEPLDQPTNSASHSSVSTPTTGVPPDVVPKPETQVEQVRTLDRKRDVRPRLVWLVLIGLAIVTLVSGLIWSTFSHGTSSRNITEFPISANEPSGITTGSDGN